MKLINHILRLVSLVVPSRSREDWLLEWQSEFHYAWGPHAEPKRGMVAGLARCVGAAMDALRLRLHAHRDVRVSFLETSLADIRFGFRTLHRRPLFAAVAILTLGLGIGAATAMFSVVDGVLIQSVPFREPGQLYNVWQTVEGARGAPGLVGRTWDRLPMSFAQYSDWRSQNTVFEEVAVHNAVKATITGAGEADRIWKGIGSASLLSVLGAQTVSGRWFLPGEEGAESEDAVPVAVLSYEAWQNRLGGDPEVLSKHLTLDGTTHSIVGVLPPSFKLRYLGMHWLGEDRDGIRDVWVPLGTRALGGGNNLEAIGRLRPEVSVERALAETSRILRATRQDSEVRLVPRADDETHGLNSPLLLLFGATGLLLLIACSNIAALSLGELQDRRFELATRSALGAGRGRIARQLVTESLMIGISGSLVGALVAVGGTQILVATAPPLPRIGEVGVDFRVLAFAALLGTIAGLLFGTAPAIASMKNSHRPTLSESNRTGSVGRGKLEQIVIISEIALTAVLLVAGGLLARSLSQLLAVDPGFDPEGLATIQITLPSVDYGDNRLISAAYVEIRSRLEALPGVSAVTAASRLPFPGLTNTTSRQIVGRKDDVISAQQVRTLPGYHETLGIPLFAGRRLSDSDGPDSPPVLMISENTARRHWPDESPVGAQLRGWGGENATIVGIVGNVKRNRLGAEADRVFYTSLLQRPNRTVSLVARTDGDPAALLARMREAVREYDDGVPVTLPRTMQALIQESASEERYRALLMSVFGGLACVLAAAGVFGVSARAVALRTREYGIRLALGAESRVLMRMVLRSSLATGLLGTFAGIITALWATRLMSRLLFGVLTWDPITYAAVGFLLIVVCLVAAYIPARRVTRVDPIEVLRAE